MKFIRAAGAILLGYALVVLITEFGFRLFPGGRAPRNAGLAITSLATLIAASAGFTGGYVAATLARIRPVLAALFVAAPLLVESVWLLSRAPKADLAFESAGAVVLIGATVAGGAARALRLRHHRTV